MKMPGRDQVIDVLTAWLLFGITVPVLVLLFAPTLPGGVPAFVLWNIASVFLGLSIALQKKRRVTALIAIAMLVIAFGFGWATVLWYILLQAFGFFGRGLGF